MKRLTSYLRAFARWLSQGRARRSFRRFRPSRRLIVIAWALAVFISMTASAGAQPWRRSKTQVKKHAARRRYDVGVMYSGQFALRLDTVQRFWMQGGSVQVGTNVWRHLDVFADLTGTHSGSIGKSSVPLSLITVSMGGRYRYQMKKKFSIYGQALVGGAAGFDSLFPTATGTQTSAHSLALQFGGGLDYLVTPQLDIRLLEVDWLRTRLPNSSSNVQNILRLGAGAVLHF